MDENKKQHKKIMGIAILAFLLAIIAIGNISTQSSCNCTTSISGSITFFLHNDSNLDTPDYIGDNKTMNSSFFNNPLSYTNISSLANGNTTLQVWISPVMNLTLLPHGVHELHIHALKVSNGGNRHTKLFYACGVVNSTGGNVSIRSTSEFSQEVTTVAPYQEFNMDMLMSDENINLTDRMIVVLYANQTGTGNLPDIQIQYNDLTDARLTFPTVGFTLQDIINAILPQINQTNSLSNLTASNNHGLVYAYQSGANQGGFSAGVSQKVKLNSTLFNPYGEFNISNSSYTVPVTGYYDVTAHVTLLTPVANNAHTLRVLRNGLSILESYDQSRSNDPNTALIVSSVIQLNQGDIVYVDMAGVIGTGMAVYARQQATYMSIRLLTQ